MLKTKPARAHQLIGRKNTPHCFVAIRVYIQRYKIWMDLTRGD
jgi:hypothetical protein